MKFIDVAAAIIHRPGGSDGEFLLGQRAPDTFYPGYWEFPGGKVEADETPQQALVRELAEELGIEVLRADPWIVREHEYAHAHVRLHFFHVREWRGELRDHVHAALAWQRSGTPTVAPMLPANAPVLAALALPDFYAITAAATIGVAAQIDALVAALDRGLRLVQLREAELPDDQRAKFVHAAVKLCQSAGARVLVNGDAALAHAAGADGLHLPTAQLVTLGARPDFALVAASAHNRAELERAAQLGLDFAVLGPVCPTASHPERAALGWQQFSALVAGIPLPVYALGGMVQADLDPARRAGAQGIAAIRANWANDTAAYSGSSPSIPTAGSSAGTR